MVRSRDEMEEKAEETTGADVWRRKFEQINKWFLCFFGGTACGILVPRPGIEPMSSAVEGQSLSR